MGARALLSGGAGYVGSVAVMALLEAGYEVVVVDDLSTGYRAAVPEGAELVELSLADADGLDKLIAARSFDVALHFAARSLVSESMVDPLAYLGDNAIGAINLLRSLVRHGVGKLVLSSTAAVYGDPQQVPIDEEAPRRPTNPYGESKLFIENMLAWIGRAHGLRWAALRYFNAAGAEPSGQRGEAHQPETHLIPLVLATALGQRPHIEIRGTNYPTPDGSCIRDYVHVCDLADAHLLAIEALDHHPSLALNLGSGGGHSVIEVVEAARLVTATDIEVVHAERRPGDPAILVASCARAHKLLGWQPQHDLQSILASAWRWHAAHPHGYRQLEQSR